MRIFRLIIFFFIGGSSVTLAQSPGATEMYLFDLSRNGDGSLRLDHARLMSDFNRGGYTSQPWFAPDNRVLVSVRQPESAQHDVWSLHPAEGTYWEVTRTAVNEFSPRKTPDPAFLSVLRQVPGEQPVQQVVRISLGSGDAEVLTPGLSDVGYYTWIDDDEFALFSIAGGAHTLVHYNIRTHQQRVVTDHIGRCLLTLPDGEVLFVHKISEGVWFLKAYDPVTSAFRLIAETPGRTEDFCRLQDGTILMGREGRLYAWSPRNAISWEIVADLSAQGIQRITRLAVSPDNRWLILVNEPTIQ